MILRLMGANQADRSISPALMPVCSPYPQWHIVVGKGEQGMDGPKFDDLARALGQGSSRRTLLRGLAGGVAGLVAGTVVRPHRGALAREITICHATGDPSAPWQSLTIDQSDFNQHARHGDFLRVECCA